MINIKRNYIEPLKYNIETIYPLFEWKYCIGCHKEIRREKLWYYLEIFHNGRNNREWYGCKDCFKTKQNFIDAIDVINQTEKEKFIKNLPNCGSAI